jgi:hypothetical protein
VFQGDLKAFWRALKNQALIEERRNVLRGPDPCPAAPLVSGAHWYGDEVAKPKAPSVFFEELAAWGEEAGLASVDRGEEPGEENPVYGYRTGSCATGRALPGSRTPTPCSPRGGGGRLPTAVASEGSGLAERLDHPRSGGCSRSWPRNGRPRRGPWSIGTGPAGARRPCRPACR